MNHTDSCIKVCNRLLRGELSAIETYLQALEKFEGKAEALTLNRILDEHQQSAAALRNHITEMGVTPDTDSGAWGAFANAVEATAKMIGESAALTALKAGEEHGIDDYEEALKDPEVMEEAKTTIRETLLPRLRDHVVTLDGLAA